MYEKDLVKLLDQIKRYKHHVPLGNIVNFVDQLMAFVRWRQSVIWLKQGPISKEFLPS